MSELDHLSLSTVELIRDDDSGIDYVPALPPDADDATVKAALSQHMSHSK